MNLHIRDPRALDLAEKLAEKKGVSVSDAVIAALESELKREERPLRDRLADIANDLAAQSRPGGRDMTKDEIDEMWGH